MNTQQLQNIWADRVRSMGDLKYNKYNDILAQAKKKSNENIENLLLLSSCQIRPSSFCLFYIF